MDGVTYGSKGRTRYPSPIIWADCPFQAIELGDQPGYALWDDFIGVNVASQTDIFGDSGPWYAGGTGTQAIAKVTSAIGSEPLRGGFLSLQKQATTDNASAWITKCGAMMQTDLNSGNKWWMETRVAKSVVSGAGSSFFAGIGEIALAVDAGITADASTMIDESYFGFHHRESGTTGTIFPVINTGGGAGPFDMLSGGVATVQTTGLIVANTFLKLGMKFDGKDRISIYCDGVLQGTYTISAALGAAVGIPMSPVIIVAGGSSTDAFYIDWVRAAYEERVQLA